MPERFPARWKGSYTFIADLADEMMLRYVSTGALPVSTKQPPVIFMVMLKSSGTSTTMESSAELQSEILICGGDERRNCELNSRQNQYLSQQNA